MIDRENEELFKRAQKIGFVEIDGQFYPTTLTTVHKSLLGTLPPEMEYKFKEADEVELFNLPKRVKNMPYSKLGKFIKAYRVPDASKRTVKLIG